jgi:predicted Zn-ribbon and HTH transcriptional regulator
MAIAQSDHRMTVYTYVIAVTNRVLHRRETALKPLDAIPETIRERADCALKQLQHVEEQRSMRWKYKDCEYVKHFTRPVPLEAAGRCPRCKSASFDA